MKFALALLAVIGLSQASILPHSGNEHLQKAIRNILDLIPMEKVQPVADRSLVDELMDFAQLVPVNDFIEVMLDYIMNDEEVQQALTYVLEPEFQDYLRVIEATKEQQALVIKLEQTGLPVIKAIQEFHKAIGMEEYVPPKVNSMFESEIGVHKVGDGFQAMLNDLVALLPEDKIHELYNEKMKTTNAFSNFVNVMKSSEMAKILNDLYNLPAHKKWVAACLERGLDLKALADFYKKIIPIS